MIYRSYYYETESRGYGDGTQRETLWEKLRDEPFFDDNSAVFTAWMNYYVNQNPQVVDPTKRPVYWLDEMLADEWDLMTRDDLVEELYGEKASDPSFLERTNLLWHLAELAIGYANDLIDVFPKLDFRDIETLAASIANHYGDPLKLGSLAKQVFKCVRECYNDYGESQRMLDELSRNIVTEFMENLEYEFIPIEDALWLGDCIYEDLYLVKKDYSHSYTPPHEGCHRFYDPEQRTRARKGGYTDYDYVNIAYTEDEFFREKQLECPFLTDEAKEIIWEIHGISELPEDIVEFDELMVHWHEYQADSRHSALFNFLTFYLGKLTNSPLGWEEKITGWFVAKELGRLLRDQEASEYDYWDFVRDDMYINLNYRCIILGGDDNEGNLYLYPTAAETFLVYWTGPIDTGWTW